MSSWAPHTALPRVTAVMGAMGLAPDYSGVDPAVLQAASERGSLVHRLIELAHTGAPALPRVPFQVMGYWLAFQRFVDETGHTPIYSELVVQHPTWRYLGHLDRIGWHGTQRVLVDWKCVAALDEAAVAVQLAAYRMAYAVLHPDEPVHLCAAVQLMPDGRYRQLVVDADAAEVTWRAALLLYHWRVKHGRIAPRMY